MISEIRMENLELEAYLGWNDEEREKLQRVQICIHLIPVTMPKAVLTDKLADTICYQELETKLIAEINQKTFRLLEHLGYCCYHSIKNLVPQDSEFSISVTKFLDEKRGSRTFVLRSPNMAGG